MAQETKSSLKEGQPESELGPQAKSTARPAKNPPGRATKPVSLIYVPLHLGGSHRGVSMGPAAIRVAEIKERIEALGFIVADEIDIPVPHSVCWWDRHEGPKCVPEITEVSLAVADAVERALAAGKIPITIGGDHSLAIGSIAGVARHFQSGKQNFGLVWFDAHGDINTPATSQSGNVHGMPLAVALGRGDKRLTELLGFSPKIAGERTALIGIRDLDEPERDLIDDTGITAFTMREIDHLGLGEVTARSLRAVGVGDAASKLSGLHVSFDIDVIDPDVAPGVSTPARGGLNYREAMLALTLLAESGLITSVDIAELNPANDVRNSTADLACELILSTLGKRIL